MTPIRYRVLFLASWYPSRVHPVSGIFIKRHAQALAKFCDVAVLYVGFDGRLRTHGYEVEKTEEEGIPTVRVYCRAGIRVPILSKLIKLVRYLSGCYCGLKVIRQEFGRPDFAHVNVMEPAGLLAVMLKYFLGIPYIVTEHCDAYLRHVLGVERLGPVRMAFAHLVTRWSDGVTTDSVAVRDAMVKLGFRGRFHVVPNVAEPPPGTGEPKDETSQAVAVHVSLLSDRQKNLSGLLAAAANVYHERNRRDFRLHIIGDGPERPEHEQRARELGLLDTCVFFHGYVSEEVKGEWLSRATFHVLNSNFEGFSVVTAEAIACGTPVISTRCGGPQDFVNEEVGLLVDAGDGKALADAMVYMLEHAGRYDRKRLREYARQRFAADVIGRRMYEVYRSCVRTWRAGNRGEQLVIASDWSVLDVGSGHNPFRRANVLLESELRETGHRTAAEAKVLRDRPMIVADALCMPLREKVFDYAVASHVAEHVEDPGRLCHELTRVARRGYIETPGIVTEMLLNEPAHRWIVRRKGETLVFRRKRQCRPPSKIFYGIFNLNQSGVGHRPIHSESRLLKAVSRLLQIAWRYVPLAYTRYHWEEEIKWEIRN